MVIARSPADGRRGLRLVALPHSSPSHLATMLALARALAARGHRTIFLVPCDLVVQVPDEGFAAHAIGRRDHPPGHMAWVRRRTARLSGAAAACFALAACRRWQRAALRDAPRLLRACAAHGLLADQLDMAGVTIAEIAGLPAISVCSALAANPDPAIPPATLPLRHGRTAWHRWRNRMAYAALDGSCRPIIADLNRCRERHGLPALGSLYDTGSPLLHISQQPEGFDLPRERPSPVLAFVGPLGGSQPGAVFPWERLDGRPLVYASLGTLHTGFTHILRATCAACAQLGVQLVVSAGGHARDLAGSAAGAIILDRVPQVELLRRCRVFVTHAGLNSALEALAAGVPMVAVPLAHDQFGVAERLRWTGAGIVVPSRAANATRLRDAIARLLGGRAHAEAAARLRGEIAGSGGAVLAAQLIEQALARAAQAHGAETSTCAAP